jgi:hypothetical protein
MSNVRYIVDWSTGESHTFTATGEDCQQQFAQHFLFCKCDCVDGSTYVPISLQVAPFCQDIPPFLINYDSINASTYGSWIMKYGNSSFDYAAEAVRLGVTVRYPCFQNVSQSHFLGDWRKVNMTTACRQL